MKHEGPYREDSDLESKELEQMEKEIAAEEKISIRLPEKIKGNYAVDLFDKAIESNIKPEDIVFYSLDTGILKYGYQTLHPTAKSFYYYSPKNRRVELEIYFLKTKPHLATIYNLRTKTDIQAMEAASQKQKLAEDPVYRIEQRVETGTDEDLRELKTNLERVLFTINDRLEEKK